MSNAPMPAPVEETPATPPPNSGGKVIQVRATVGPARMRARHWGQILSFLLLVIVPFLLATWYLLERAAPQFASTAGFTVRTSEGSTPTDFLGGITQLAAGPATVDGDILHDFIESQAMVQRLLERSDLRAHYAQHAARDPIFALVEDATIEDFVRYWRRVVRLSYDQSTGLMELRVLAFDADTAQGIAQAIIEEGQDLVNELNGAARQDAMQYAERDLEIAADRLRAAREAITAFRTRTQILDPEADLEGRLGVLTNLQQQLAEVLVEFDLLAENTTNPDDPRLRQASQRIDVIQARIEEERGTFNTISAAGREEDYPALMTEYESLLVERELAETAYGVALAAMDLARNTASRQSRYLAVYIQPTYPETPEFPRTEMILAQAAMILLVAWSILALIVYSIRDRQ